MQNDVLMFATQSAISAIVLCIILCYIVNDSSPEFVRLLLIFMKIGEKSQTPFP